MSKNLPKRNFKDPQTRINSEDIDDCESIDELREWKMNLEGAMVDADLRINTAKGNAASNGDFMEPEKYNKLLSYRRVLGFLHQKIIFRERYFKSLKPEKKDNDSFPRIFMQCAKVILSKSVYEHILEKTKELSPEDEK
jgi:hypothetical protein